MYSRLFAASWLIAACALAHDVPLDASRDTMAPFGARPAARSRAAFDAQRQTYVFTHEGTGERLRYEINVSSADLQGGKLTVTALLDGKHALTPVAGASPILATGGRGQILSDGSMVWRAVDIFDVDADGAHQGFMVERSRGYGDVIRLGTGFPIEPHYPGFALWKFDGPAGKYRFTLRYFDDADDKADDAYIRVLVAGHGAANVSPAVDDNAWHELTAEVDLDTGDEIRIDARSDDSNGTAGDFCRISTLTLKPIDAGKAHGSRLVKHALDGDAVVLSFADPAVGLEATRTTRIQLVGKTLVLRTQGQREGFPKDCGYSRFDLGRVAGAGHARLVRLPYCNVPVVCADDTYFVSAYLDRFHSNGTMRSGKPQVHDDGTVSADQGFEYWPNSAGRYEPLDETAYVTVSKQLLDVTPRINGRTPGPGRGDLGKRVVLDIWRLGRDEDARELFELVHGLGMHELLIIAHNWRCYGYDRKQPAFYPADPARWTEEEFQALVARVKQLGFRIAVHENYNHMDWDSPYHDRRFMSKLADGRISPGPTSRPKPPTYPIASDKMLHFAQIEGHKIHHAYALNAAYLDVTPCVQPGMNTWDMHIDLDATNTKARSWAMAYRNAWRLFVHHRDLYGLLTGEGGSYASWSAGYCEAVERQVRTKMNTPIVPHFELLAIKPLSFHHGMGYYSRYFPKDESRSKHNYAPYHAMEIAFGHAGFMQHFDAGRMPRAVEALKHYYLLRKLQQLYADATPTKIEYWDGARWLDVNQAMLRNYDFVQAQLHIAYDNGLDIWLNFRREGEWRIKDTALPAYGWVAQCPGARLQAWSAMVRGRRVEYASCDDYLFAYGPQGDGPSVAVAYRKSGMGGLSGRDVGGMVVAANTRLPRILVGSPKRWQPAKGYALTVLNEGKEAISPALDMRDLNVKPTALVIRKAFAVVQTVRDYKTQWTPKRAGEYRVAFQYVYTDPGHLATTSKQLVCDAVAAKPITVTAQATAAKAQSIKFRRSKAFVEMEATIVVPSACAVGKPVDVAALGVCPGVRGNDDDFATDYALVFEHVASREREVVAFAGERPSFSQPMRIEPGQPFAFPPSTVTTIVFEPAD